MRKLAPIALAAVVALTGTMVGMASSASAALSDGDAPAWHQKGEIQVAARGGERGARQDGGRGRDAHRDKKGDVIWRVRDGKHRPFFLFRGRGDCSTQAVKVRDTAGNIVVRNRWVCN